MKKRILKWVALVIALSLLAFLGYFANSMLGNPISKWLATQSAENYLQEHFPGTDYCIERIAFSFKDSCYHAFVESPSSVDTYFSVCIDQLGQVRYDTFDSVESGWNTYVRLEEEYRELTDTVFESPLFPYSSNICFGSLEVIPREALEDPHVTGIAPYALIQNDLVLDKVYDIRELGAQAGHLIVYIDTDEISFEQAAAVMLDVRARFDSAGIPFRAMDFCLQYPLPEEGPRPDGDIRVEHFLYEDIYEEDLPRRLEEAHYATQAYYDALDGK